MNHFTSPGFSIQDLGDQTGFNYAV